MPGGFGFDEIADVIESLRVVRMPVDRFFSCEQFHAIDIFGGSLLENDRFLRGRHRARLPLGRGRDV